MSTQIDFFGAHDPVGTLERAVTPWAKVGSSSLFHGDSLEILEHLSPDSIDVIFADPPYFLSNGGTTCSGGERVSVDKGDWDRSQGLERDHAFNRRWLELSQRALKPDGTIWVSGTMHVIFSVGFAMQELGFKLLNDITWEKPNPPPNMGCRCFTHSTETIIWAARSERSAYYFDYEAMKRDNDGKQMKDVWRFTAPGKAERKHGAHPTQKPVKLLRKVLEASAPPGAVVLDPFNGSGTTGVAALERDLTYIGVERKLEHLRTSKRRLCEIIGEPCLEADEPAVEQEEAPGNLELFGQLEV